MYRKILSGETLCFLEKRLLSLFKFCTMSKLLFSYDLLIGPMYIVIYLWSDRSTLSTVALVTVLALFICCWCLCYQKYSAQTIDPTGYIVNADYWNFLKPHKVNGKGFLHQKPWDLIGPAIKWLQMPKSMPQALKI